MKNFLIIFYITMTIVKFNSSGLVLKSPVMNNDKFKITKFIINKDNNRALSAVLSSYLILPAKFTGSALKDGLGNYSFKIEKIKFLTSWPNGWTEGEYEATGEILFINTNDNWKVKIKDQIEVWDLLKGEMRYHDKFFRNEEGKKHVQDRMTRIKRIIEFIKDEKVFPDHFENVWFKTDNEDSFNRDVVKYLFDKNTKLPDDLIPVRASHTLEKDIDEAVELFFMEYNMDYFLTKYLPELIMY